MTYDRYPPKLPSRPGWSVSRRFFGAPGVCPHCLHDNDDHFWWDGPGASQELGCYDCRDNICKINRKEERSMSALNLCERCDSLMLGKAVAEIRVNDSPDANTEKIELCPGCISDFYDFMHSGPQREQRAFKEPYKKPDENGGTKALPPSDS